MMYESSTFAEQDCVDLTKVMAEKHALHHTGFRGGKIVVHISDQQKFDRRNFLNAMAQLLNQFPETFYTGCDVGTTYEDMQFLASICPFVLSGIPQNIDTNLATSYGIVGSVEAGLEWLDVPLHKAKVVLVGCGNVGAGVANLLIDRGAAVFVSDIDPDKISLSIQGNHEILSAESWPTFKCDILINCAFSKDITTEIASALQCKMIVSSANVPYRSIAVRDILEARDVVCIPPFVSNAGAVISDSVEFYRQEEFLSDNQQILFEFIMDCISQKTAFYLDGNLMRTYSSSSFDLIANKYCTSRGDKK